MTSKIKSFVAVVFATIMFMTIPAKNYSQGINGWIKKQGEKLNQKIDKIFNGNKDSNTPNSEKNQGGKLKNSRIDESEFTKVASKPLLDTNNYTRVKIAGNLLVDIKGKYPKGYQPNWRFFTYNSPLTFDAGNYVVAYPLSNTDTRNIAIGDYKGKAVLRWDVGFECFADITINDDYTVLTNKPQTFKVTSFERILNNRKSGEKCRSSNGNTYIDGGFEGKLTLSANEDGDIKMNLWIENYSEATAYAPSFVSYTYLAENINVENEMSAEKATSIVKAEQEAKQKQKDYMAKTTKQADSLQKIIAKRYAQANCKDCFYSSSGGYISTTTVDQYYVNSGNYAGSRTDWDLNIKTEVRNTCNYNLMFIGIQQLYDENKGYYLKEVTKVMPANYSYSADQGAFASVFTSLIGGGSEFNIKVQDKYYPTYAAVGATQWIKVIKK